MRSASASQRTRHSRRYPLAHPISRKSPSASTAVRIGSRSSRQRCDPPPRGPAIERESCVAAIQKKSSLGTLRYHLPDSRQISVPFCFHVLSGSVLRLAVYHSAEGRARVSTGHDRIACPDCIRFAGLASLVVSCPTRVLNRDSLRPPAPDALLN